MTTVFDVNDVLCRLASLVLSPARGTTDRIVGIGLDVQVVELVEWAHAMAPTTFPHHVLAPAEICRGWTQALAVAWSSKEAAMKAIGVGVGDVGLPDLVLSGRPGNVVRRVHLAGAARTAGRAKRVTEVSVAAESVGSMMVAMAIARGQGNG